MNYWRKPEEDVKELFDYALSKGITFRDDTPLVHYYVENYLETWTVSHPYFFEAVYKTKPTVLELEHYRNIKRNGDWIGKNGEKIIPEFGVSSADIFRIDELPVGFYLFCLHGVTYSFMKML